MLRSRLPGAQQNQPVPRFHKCHRLGASLYVLRAHPNDLLEGILSSALRRQQGVPQAPTSCKLAKLDSCAQQSHPVGDWLGCELLVAGTSWLSVASDVQPACGLVRLLHSRGWLLDLAATACAAQPICTESSQCGQIFCFPNSGQRWQLSQACPVIRPLRIVLALNLLPISNRTRV